MTTATRPALRRRRDPNTAVAVSIQERAIGPISMLEPTAGAVALLPWLAENLQPVRRLLHQHGAVLCRGFSEGALALRDATELVAAEPSADYQDAATPRRRLAAGVYSSTEYPPDQVIELHNEACYAAVWPLVLGFACEVPADSGGRTPLADCREIWRRIPADIRDRLAQHGVRYLRNFTPGLGIPWEDAFDVPREQVVAHCARRGVHAQWRDHEHLRTMATRPAAVRHPVNGEWSWFNQAVGFHLSTLGAELATELLAQLGPDRVPKTTTYGDGSPFTESDLTAIRAAVAAATVGFDWKAGDVLLVDNILLAHGRESFTGARRVLVAMAGTREWAQVSSLPERTDS